ncbi:hypothetical protein [Paraburkholderia caribensis]|uniref:hypothetical protein n=1 Tax=Paraburkholderia caribensis TaxID=75105 RepID=UPI0034D22D4B
MTQSYAASRKKSSILYVVYQTQLFSGDNNPNVARHAWNRHGWPSERLLYFFPGLRTVLLERFVNSKTRPIAISKKLVRAFPCANAANCTPVPIPPRNECAAELRHAVTCGGMPLEIAVSRYAQRSQPFPYVLNSHIAKRVPGTYRLAIAEFGPPVARF